MGQSSMKERRDRLVSAVLYRCFLSKIYRWVLSDYMRNSFSAKIDQEEKVFLDCLREGVYISTGN